MYVNLMKDKGNWGDWARH